MRILIISLFTGLIFLGCQREDDQLDCTNPGTQPMDVIAGSPYYIGGVGDPAWAFLSDEQGNSSDAVLFTAYPFFLNAPASCQDHYTVNVIEPLPKTNPTTGEAADVVRLTSYLNMPVRQSVSLLYGIENPKLPTYFWEARTIVVQDIPPGVQWKFSWDISSFIPWEVDESAGEIRIEAPSIGGNLRYLYLSTQLPGENVRRALRLDFINGPDTYSFSAAQLMELRTIQVSEQVKEVAAAEIIDPENGDILFLEESAIENGQVQFWITQAEAPYLFFLSMRSDSTERHYWREIFTSFPTELEAPEPPVKELLWSENSLLVELNYPGFLDAEMDKVGQYYSANYRGLRGVLPAGLHNFKLPYLPDNFLTEYPSVELPTDLYKQGFKVAFWHFSTLSDPAAYHNVEQLPWATQYRYHYYEVDVE